MGLKGLRGILFVGLVLALVVGFVGTATAQEADWSTLIEQAKSAVVLIETDKGSGSGTIISPNGYILTAAHVIKGASRVSITVEDMREYQASVVQADYEMDVAILKISANSLTWLALGNSDQARYDEEVRALGYPWPGAGRGFVATSANIEGFRTRTTTQLIQLSAAVNPGNSGGPLIDEFGRIIGVVSELWSQALFPEAPPTPFALAVTINSAKQVIPYGVLPSGPSPVQPAVTPPAHAGPIRVPEDYATIQAAMSAAGEGGEIRVSSGTYKGDIAITKPVSIEGETGIVIHGSVRVSSVNSLYLANLTIQGGMEVRDSSGVTLKSLVITGNTGDGLLTSGSSVSISDTTIQNNQGAGLVAVLQSRLMIANCSIEKNDKVGISITLGSQASIVGNRVTANGSDGIAVFGATADLRNNILRQNEGYGLNSDASATLTGAGNRAGADVPEEFSTIEAAINALNKLGGKTTAVPAGIISTAITIGPGTYNETANVVRSVDLIGAGSTSSIVLGIKVSGTAQVLIQDLAIKSDGISLEDASQVTIKDCTISENNWHGITLYDAVQATIENCTISNNGGSGVCLTDSATATVENCTISKNGYDGILITDTAQTVVENCTVSRNGGSGVSVRDSAQTELQGNLIRWNGDYGISAEDGAVLSGGDNTIPGGKVPSDFPTIQAAVNGGNEGGAIKYTPAELVKRGTIAIAPGTYEERVGIGYSVDLIGSGSERTTVRGIYVSGATQVLIQDLAVKHVINSNDRSGISIGEAARVTIRNCHISGYKGTGIFEGIGINVWFDAQAEIEDCTISENEYGVYAEAASQATIVHNIISNNLGSGIFSLSAAVTGHDNTMRNNGVDLEGNVPGSLRIPLKQVTEQQIRFPDSRYDSLQSAVDALVPGGRLVIDSGVYEAGITISKQIQITAADGAQVTLQARNETTPVFSLVHDADLIVTGVTVTKGKSGLLIASDAKATIENCTISENKDGIHLRDTAQTIIKDCTISENNDGIHISDAAQTIIKDCTISENNDGIHISDAALATIANNEISDNTHSGILALSGWISDFSGRVTGHDNTMRNNGVDLVGNVPGALRTPLESPTEPEIRFPDPRYQSLQSAVDALVPGGRLVLNSGVYEAGITISKQIQITAANGAQVTLQARNETTPGFSLVHDADLRLIGVTVTKGKSGLLLASDAKATIENCTISENEDGIQLLDTAKTMIENCTISGNRYEGIHLKGSAQATVEASTIEKNHRGIEVWNTACANINGCTISNNSEAILLLSSALTTLDTSTILGNGWGIEVSRTANVKIANCTISNGAFGLIILMSAQVTMDSCVISSNNHEGISLRGAAHMSVSSCSITNNDGYGIECNDFTGQVIGSGNYIPGPDQPDGNKEGALDPPYPGDPWPEGFLKQ